MVRGDQEKWYRVLTHEKADSSGGFFSLSTDWNYGEDGYLASINRSLADLTPKPKAAPSDVTSPGFKIPEREKKAG